VRKGFSHDVAPLLIREIPVMTAIEVADLALERSLCDSDSVTPVQSLANTLAREVREGQSAGHRSAEGARRAPVLHGGQLG